MNMKRKLKKENVAAAVCTVIAFAAAMVFYFWFDPDPLLRMIDPLSPVNDASQLPSAVGCPAGADIPRLSGQEDFEHRFTLDYVTAEPEDLVPTGVWHLKSWVEPYERQRSSRGRSYGPKLYKTPYRLSKYNNEWDDYNQFYLIKLPDGSYIAAEIPRDTARAIGSGKSVTLPIGQKIPLTFPDSLREISEEYGASKDLVLYAFNDQWQEEHHFLWQVFHLGGTVVVFFGLGIVLILLSDKIFKKKKKDQLEPRPRD